MKPAVESFDRIPENFDAIMQLIERRKHLNGRLLYTTTGGIIQHGILKGYALHAKATWMSTDIASQLLGLYEQDVCALLWSLAGRRDCLIDLGAADGFYGLGLVAVDAFANSVCFEIAPEARHALAERRDRLGLADRVEIRGDALVELPALLDDGTLDLNRAVVLCDIEEAEFALFTDALLARLAPAFLIIENHDFDRAGGFPRATALAQRAARHFHVAEMMPGPRDVARLPLVATWNDNDRALLLSEGRLSLASWLVLSPLSEPPLTQDRLKRIREDYTAIL